MKLLTSRRFIAAVLGILGIVAVDQFGITPEKVGAVIDAITQIVTVLIGGYVAEDVVSTVKGTK